MKTYLRAIAFVAICALSIWLVNPQAGHSQQALQNGVPMTSSAIAESCHQMKVGPGVMWWMGVATGASAGFLMAYDLASAPSNGTVVPLVAPPAVAATSNVFYSFQDAPIRYGNGLVLCFSTTGQFTLTLSATADLSAQVQ